ALPAAHRPKQVGDWIQRARKGTPPISDLEGFIEEWWKWWTSMNPGWRRVNGTLVQEGAGSWEPLECPGPNGFLSVLACLKWWRMEVPDDTDDWKKAVGDVVWVLAEMLR
ncbi:hypothetical protein DFH07DRAFT_747794, partial [Mycena maculata]